MNYSSLKRNYMAKDKTPVIFSWSGGKDSAYALHQLLQENIYDVKYLLSTMNGHNQRLSMHGVHESLIEKQAESIGIPLLKVYVYENNNEEYEKQMAALLFNVKQQGIDTIAFGDILLEDLKKYREEKNSAIGMKSIFPIWGKDTGYIVKDFVGKGFRSITCCVSGQFLSENDCGKIIDENFINSLPANIDPCGENGEYHSFCFDGPLFKNEIRFTKGDTIYKFLEIKQTSPTKTKGFWYCDLLPA